MMKSNRVPVAELRERLRYEPETGKLFWLNGQRAGREAGSVNGQGYRQIRFSRLDDFLCHRVAWALHYGAWPSEQLDHINQNRSDNRIENLRLTSNSENQRNCKRIKSQTGECCVRKTNLSATFQVGFRFNGNRYWKCGFRTVAEAAEWRDLTWASLGYNPLHGAPEEPVARWFYEHRYFPVSDQPSLMLV